MTRYKITLPMPHRDLGKNRERNIHWSRKAKLIKEHRVDAQLSAWAVVKGRPKHKLLNAKPTFYLPDKRKRDRVNLAGMLHPAWDGFQDAGLIEDDAGLILHPCEIKYDKDNPRVEIELWV